MIKITVNKNDLARVLNAITSVNNVVKALAKSIPEESAREFADELRSAITSQKYDFIPHKESYMNKKNYTGDFWHYMGTVLKSIQPWNVLMTDAFVQWFVGLRHSSAGATGDGDAGGGGTGGQRKTVTPPTKKKRTVPGEYKGREEEYRHGEVRHIDPKDYRPQTRRESKSFSFGYEPIKKKQFHTRD